jgi:hypothetical protein
MSTSEGLSFDWVKKLKLEIVDNEDGSANLIFKWDEKDPDLDYWNSLTNEQRESFIMRSLEDTIKLTSEN